MSRSLAPPGPTRTGRARERRVSDAETDWLGPVAIAVWIDIGWMLQWPLALTRIGLKAARNGYGRDQLPYAVEHRAGGAYHREGRRASL